MQDQEVLDARRARDEKDDRLRDALASAAALKDELQTLKRPSAVQISVGKAAPSYSQDDDDDEMFAAFDDRQLEVIHAHGKAQSRKPDQGPETWATPWETEKAQHAAVTSKESFDATVLKAGTLDAGILSSHLRFSFCYLVDTCWTIGCILLVCNAPKVPYSDGLHCCVLSFVDLRFCCSSFS